MDPILQVLFSWQFIFFGLAIAAVMNILRIIVEYVGGLLKRNLAKSKLWNDLILPILPVAMGASTAYFFKLFPYPGFPDTSHGYPVAGNRIIFGLVAGLLSTLLYRVIKALLYQKIVGMAQSFQYPGMSGMPGVTTTTITTLPINGPTEPIPVNEISSRGQL